MLPATQAPAEIPARRAAAADARSPMRRGHLCPYCRAYNSVDDRRCVRCERWLPPPAVAGFVRDLSETELLGAKILGCLCIAVFVLEMLESRRLQVGTDPLSGLLAPAPLPTMVHLGALTPALTWKEPFRLLSACFVHFNVLHIALNLAGLADLARVGERHVGTPRFVLTFVVTGIVGFVASAFYYGDSIGVTGGASGAVFGLDGMLLGAMAVRRDARWKAMLVRTIVYSLAFGLIMPINQPAHFGGLFAGCALGALFELESRPWRIRGLMAGVLVLSLASSVGSIVLSLVSGAHLPLREAEEARRRR